MAHVVVDGRVVVLRRVGRQRVFLVVDPHADAVGRRGLRRVIGHQNVIPRRRVAEDCGGVAGEGGRDAVDACLDSKGVVGLEADPRQLVAARPRASGEHHVHGVADGSALDQRPPRPLLSVTRAARGAIEVGTRTAANPHRTADLVAVVTEQERVADHRAHLTSPIRRAVMRVELST